MLFPEETANQLKTIYAKLQRNTRKGSSHYYAKLTREESDLIRADYCKPKVYEQRGTVTYADYQPGMYYISPADLTDDTMRSLYKTERTGKFIG